MKFSSRRRAAERLRENEKLRLLSVSRRVKSVNFHCVKRKTRRVGRLSRAYSRQKERERLGGYRTRRGAYTPAAGRGKKKEKNFAASCRALADFALASRDLFAPRRGELALARAIHRAIGNAVMPMAPTLVSLPPSENPYIASEKH